MKIYARNGRLYVDLRAEGLGRKSTGLKDTPQNRRIIEQEFREIRISKPFEHYARIYLENKKAELKAGTYAGYLRIAERFNAEFHGIPIADIKTSELSEFMRSLGISAKTERDYHTVLRGIFQEALYDDAISENIAKRLRKPKLSKPKIEPFTTDEMNRIIDTADGTLKNLVSVGFFTGMRTGEIAGLKWEDVDMEAGYIHVRRSRRKGRDDTPKTDGSARIVPILPSLVEAVKDQYAQTGLMNRYVFMNGNEPYKDFSDINDGPWKRLLRAAGVPYRRMYNMRHTFIVTMLNSGKYPVMTIAKWVGHTSPQMIFQRYAKHVESERIKADFDPFEKRDFGTLLAQSS